jgi:hypothetical protein
MWDGALGCLLSPTLLLPPVTGRFAESFQVFSILATFWIVYAILFAPMLGLIIAEDKGSAVSG